MLFLKLPIELLNKILLYLQCPIAKLIKNEIETYEKLDDPYFHQDDI